MNTGDKYGEAEVGLVPSGPFKGRLWREVPALTLHNILNAVDFGLVVLDERRVVAIRQGLRAKDRDQKSDVSGQRTEDGAQAPKGGEVAT